MRMRTGPHRQFKVMAAAQCLSLTEQWIRERLKLQHQCLADVRSLRLQGTYEIGKIEHLGISLKNFTRLKSLDLSHNALVSVQGILHLKCLENLNLYYNRISSLQEVLSLGSLQNLKSLDLRLNPVVKEDPYYRLYLIQAISKLCKLDDCVVRDRERKASLMHLSAESGLKSSQKSSPLSTTEMRNGSSNSRIASVNKMMMSKFLLREGNEETVLNHKSDMKRSILTHEAHAEEYSKPKPTHLQETRHPDGPGAPKDAPRVTFGEPSVNRCIRTHPGDQNAFPQGHDQQVCSLKGLSERKLHPTRLTYQSSDGRKPEGRSPAPERARKACKGAYRKPMELLLSLVDEYWSGKMKDHDTKHFFMQAVRILCMMEQEITNGESETAALSEKIQALSDQMDIQTMKHQSEVQRLSGQLKQAHGNIEHLDQELRSVLEENISLQKQLIKFEQQLLSDKLREMPNSQH
ncbi:Centrosomal protein of 72 kDa [Bagarius yarrelli]|uniref:Centrosomal protein of 72 kDa n=1 Tax=Bagarius yarrelli TaxID=175774 RepID=A0A556TLZ3_BAGYA|nr:Centrosomal protein of 72 kDa [Bagarius yarrelli]